MNTVNRKRLPYGNSNFEKVMTENYAYVDKTRFIELLENEPNSNLFFIRPRKFGKSLFFSMLSHYYDINGADKFEPLFGDLYIGKHATSLQAEREEARAQLEKYRDSYLFAGRTDVRYLSVVFIGKDRYEIEEL
jgi:hypothetical protein